MPICIVCKVKKPNSYFKSGGDVLKTCVDCREEVNSSEDEEDDVEENEDESESSDTETIYCDACNKSFESVDKAKKHAMTKSHQTKWNKLNKE